MVGVFLLAILCVARSQNFTAKENQQLYKMGDFTVSDDGLFAVYAVSQYSLEEKKSKGWLQSVELATNKTANITSNEWGFSDSTPVINKNNTVFFISNRVNTDNIWYVDIGSKPVQLTSYDLAV